jgi:hypothetical protein
MPADRIYWFDRADHATEADVLIADTDDEVRARAAANLGMASSVEVWRLARRVVRVSAEKPAPSQPDVLILIRRKSRVDVRKAELVPSLLAGCTGLVLATHLEN